MTGTLARVARMDADEVRWRALTWGRNTLDRAWSAARPPQWRREALASILCDDGFAGEARGHAAARDWPKAHLALAGAVRHASPRFPITPTVREALVARVLAAFPDRATDAAARAERIVAGDYDLLGYGGLRFDSDTVSPDWHLDPVHKRRAPMQFWSTVRYLDPSYGDHKIIWELNRQQHLLVLGRAYWLTGDRRYRQAALDRIAAWIRANPPLVGINWASMLELAFRVLSWTWAIHFFVDEDQDPDPWLVDCVIALDRQLQQIARNLSYYFSPNTHLLGEALALYVAGAALPWLRRATGYADLGRRVLLQELTRQVGADGGHLERSSHYHRYTLDFYTFALIVARIVSDPAAEQFRGAVARLGFAARLLADDQGHLPHIGDDDGGMLLPICGRLPDDVCDSLAVAAALTDRADIQVGPAPEEAYWLLAQPPLVQALQRARDARAAGGLGSAALPEMGYYVSRSLAGEHLVVDAGAHGFANGGHAHADALSLTLAVRNVPLFIDPGTASYTIDPAARDRFRSSALHNTVVVDGRTQSLPSGPFHWHQTANGVAHVWRTNATFDYIEASHDGYAPLEHRRHVLALHGDLLIVADVVEGTGEHDMLVHWHLDPGWAVHPSVRRVLLRHGNEQVGVAVSHGTVEAVRTEEDGVGWVAPAYGRVEPTTTLRVSMSGQAPLWIVTVVGLDPSNPVESVDPLPIWAQAGAFERTHAVRVVRSHSTDLFAVAAPARLTRDVGAALPPFETWRAGTCESDARVLFCRGSNGVTRIALVDGSMVRTGDTAAAHLQLPRVASDLHIDLSPGSGRSAGMARVSGPSFGAHVEFAGRRVAVAAERRSIARPAGAVRGGVA